jgi:hypothetical protein
METIEKEERRRDNFKIAILSWKMKWERIKQNTGARFWELCPCPFSKVKTNNASL